MGVGGGGGGAQQVDPETVPPQKKNKKSGGCPIAQIFPASFQGKTSAPFFFIEMCVI